MYSDIESDSNDSIISDHSDGGDLPSFTVFSSPNKAKEQRALSLPSPGVLSASLSAATLNTPVKNDPPKLELEQFSPHNSHTDRKALEQSRKLARKAEELAKHIKDKTERNEKVCLSFVL